MNGAYFDLIHPIITGHKPLPYHLIYINYNSSINWPDGQICPWCSANKLKVKIISNNGWLGGITGYVNETFCCCQSALILLKLIPNPQIKETKALLQKMMPHWLKLSQQQAGFTLPPDNTPSPHHVITVQHLASSSPHHLTTPPITWLYLPQPDNPLTLSPDINPST